MPTLNTSTLATPAQQLAPAALTPAAFAAFGTVLQAPPGTGRLINAGTSERFDLVDDLCLGQQGGRAQMALFRAQARQFPVALEEMERHQLGSQSFIPLGRRRFVIVVAAAGLPSDSPALWHAQAGWIRPRQLVAAQLQTPGVQVRWGQQVQGIEQRGEHWAVTDAQGQTLGEAPLLVVASAFDSLALLRPLPGFAVPLNPLRGQVSFGHLTDLSEAQRQLLPPFPVNGHGSFISGVPTPEGLPGWFIGATFERNCEQAPVREEDHAANQVRLATLLPALGEAMAGQFAPDRVQGWAGLRCTLPNRLPAVGPIDRQRLPGLWLSAGMGARGISLAMLCGELLAAWLHNETLPLPDALAKHLAAERFAGSQSPGRAADMP